MQQKFITKEEFSKRLIELFARGRISQYPRKRRDRHILLKSIVMTLSNGKDYNETEINDEIKSWLTRMHDPQGLDYVALRRYLVDEGYLDRSRNGSRYWIMEPGPSAQWFEQNVDEVEVFKVVSEAKEDYERTHRKRGEVRQKILDSATELFSKKGYEGASIREIADRAGVTVPNIYYYYNDKKGLYQATLTEGAASLLELLKKVDDPDATLRDRFLALARAKMKLARKKNATIELFTREWLDSSSPGLPPKLKSAMGQSVKYMEQIIAQAVQRGEIRPINPKLAVWHMFGLAFLQGGKFIAKFIKTKELTDDEIEDYVDLILKGLEKKD
ncbi:DUF2087 domain-containing protein [candidate division WOR-3 bacterium]|uniref:DUF2087 domain-containing protein n=1 Tax=candidate division WOR-3 bacterium TaxID=2052148 RepID=A0A9D5KB64_UNCW3|nr:DUF2087 domain-containing protein [candidate division WOR-3 bacterium]MBD3365716.1 DUF2087 domain-containing protein [candidate division WOR-3 bacterium]